MLWLCTARLKSCPDTKRQSGSENSRIPQIWTSSLSVSSRSENLDSGNRVLADLQQHAVGGRGIYLEVKPAAGADLDFLGK